MFAANRDNAIEAKMDYTQGALISLRIDWKLW